MLTRSRSCFRVVLSFAALALLALSAFSSAFIGVAHATTVRLQSTLGVIEIDLYDAAAPRTVTNFLTYVNSGAFNDTFIHRSIPGFIIQSGGYRWDDATAGASA